MRLFGKWRILIEGDETVHLMFPWQRKGLDYLLNRLLSGETVADNAFEPYGLRVRELEDSDEVISIPHTGQD